VLAVSGAILAANAVLKVYEGIQAAVKIATIAWTGAQWLLNAAQAASPIGLMVIAVVALTAAVIIAYKHSRTFRDAVNSLWDVIRRYGVYLTPLTAQLALLRLAYQKAQDLFGQGFAVAWIREAVSAFNWLKDTIANVGAAFTHVKDTVKGLTLHWINEAVSAFNWLKDTIAPLAGIFTGFADAVKAGLELKWIKDAVSSFNWLKDTASSLAGMFHQVALRLSDIVGWIKTLITWIKKIDWPSPPKWLSKIPGLGSVFSATGGASLFAYTAPAPGGLRIPRAAGASSSTLTVNVYGAVDPEGSARVIRKLLADHERRQGRTS
jgi:phage-related protein